MHCQTRKLADGCSLDAFLQALARDRELFALEPAAEGQYHLVKADRWDPQRHVLGAFRQIEPLKSVLSRPREFFGEALAEPAADTVPERIVIGVKNCDLSGLKIQDHVFLGIRPGEPGYAEARDKTLLVTADCTDCLDVCFCPVVGVKPHPEQGYDINLSPVGENCLIDSGSDRGEQLLLDLAEYLEPADADMLAERQNRRQAMFQRVVDQAAEHGLHPGMDLAGAVRGAKDSSLWGEFAQDCVECGACNFVCCTCHCFVLSDGTASENVPVRGKQWDSCLLMNFARVAGGSNPRAGRAARLRNRFEKKFSYFPEVLDCYACDGCGRCTEVCTGNIDIRAVLKRACDDTQSVHADPGHD